MAQFTEEEKDVAALTSGLAKVWWNMGLIEDGDKILIGLFGRQGLFGAGGIVGNGVPVSINPVFRCRRTCSDEEYTLSKRCGLSEGVRRVGECLLFSLKRSLMPRQIPASLLVFFVLGIGGRHCLP